MTYSFGSLCFGSLFVSVIQFLRQIASIGRSAVRQQGNTFYQIVFCCLEFLAGLMEGIMEYFNHYAYTQIALYGKAPFRLVTTLIQGYSEAARDTWRMMKNRGVDAIINDLLIDNVLTMGSVFVAFTTGLLSYLYLRYTHPAYNATGGFYIPVVAFGFLVGLQMVSISQNWDAKSRRILRWFQSKVAWQRCLLRWLKILTRSPRIFRPYIRRLSRAILSLHIQCPLVKYSKAGYSRIRQCHR